MLLLSLCFAALSFSPAYSADATGKPSLLEKVKKTDKAMDTIYPPKKGETPLSDKQMATAAKCSENHEACAEKCAAEEVNDACDARCKEELSLCEKDLPKDWKTIK
jgi:hypothetical protein